MEYNWNLWHGCHKKSEGCLNCYMFRGDLKYNRNPEDVHKTKSFYSVISKNKNGQYKIPSNSMIYTCFSSDFFVEDADPYRSEAFEMMKERSDCIFFFITKRPERIMECLPKDWFDGYDNVWIAVTVENQVRADERLPIYMKLPIKRKSIVVEPILERVDLTKYLDSSIKQVVCGGESGENARICNFDWILDLKKQCDEYKIPFWFKQTGYNFIKDNKIYIIKRKYQFQQARIAQSRM